MINELYSYAYPKLSAKQENPSSAFALILYTILFSSLAAIFGNIVFGIVVTAIYLVLSLLTFLDKDKKSRYMELVSLSTLDISIIGIYMFSVMFSEYQAALWSILSGIIFSVIYEIVLIVKIKNRLYSNPSNSKKAPTIISASTIFLFVLIFKLLNNNSGTKDLAVIVLMLLCGAIILVTVISIQKLIVYLVVRDKIQANLRKTGDGSLS